MSKEANGLTSIDLSILTSALEWAGNHTAAAVIGIVVAVGSASIGSAMTARRMQKQSKQSLNSDRLELQDVIVTYTEYLKTEQTNPETNNLFVRQRLSTIKLKELGDLLPNEWMELIAKNLEEAKRSCKDDNPYFTPQLIGIIENDEQNRINISSRLGKELTNRVSDAFNDGQLLYNFTSLKEGEEIAYNNVIPFLVYEQGAEKKQLRLFMIDVEDLVGDNILNLDSRDILYQEKGCDDNGRELWSNRADHPHILRLHTFKKLIELYREKQEDFEMLRIYGNEIREIDHKQYVIDDQTTHSPHPEQ